MEEPLLTLSFLQEYFLGKNLEDKEIIHTFVAKTKTILNMKVLFSVLLLSEWEDDGNKILSAIWSYGDFDSLSFSALMGRSDVDNFNKAFNMVVPPLSINTLSSVQLFSRIVQMLPLDSAEWRL